MADQPAPQDAAPISAWLIVIVALCVVTGLAFRFTNLGTKVFWQDEASDAVHLGGHRFRDVNVKAYTGKEITTGVVLAYQHVDPRSHFLDTVTALAIDDPKHPPLYFAFTRAWIVTVGDSVTSIRAVSAIFGALAIGAMYFLAAELFGSKPAALLSVAIISVSPFFVIYSQEATEYSLWSVTILLSTTALLRSLRINTRRAWLLYEVSVAVALFTHTLFVLVILSHVAYVLFLRFPRPVIWQFVRATIMGVAVFAPWACMIFIEREKLKSNTGWLNVDSYTKFGLAQRLFVGIATIFFDIDPVAGIRKIHDIPVFGFVALVVVACAMVYLWRTAPRKVSFLLVSLCAMQIVLLLLPDLIFGGKRSSPFRYMTPLYIAVQLAVVYCIAQFLFDSRRSALSRLVWGGATGLLLTAGVVSCWIRADQPTWWNKPDGASLIKGSAIVNTANRPVVLSNLTGTNFGNMLALSHRLKPDTRLILQNDLKWPAVPPHETGEVFFLTTDRGAAKPLLVRLPGRLDVVADGMFLQLRPLSAGAAHRGSP